MGVKCKMSVGVYGPHEHGDHGEARSPAGLLAPRARREGKEGARLQLCPFHRQDGGKGAILACSLIGFIAMASV